MLNPPTSGTVYLEGDNITDFSSKQLQELRRTKVAMVFQNFGLISNRNVWKTPIMVWKYAAYR